MRKRVIAVQSVLGLLAVLAVMVLAAGPVAAHHKDGHDKGGGKSQSEDAGKTQGKSPSDPDDDGHGPDRSNGGPDKPGGSGGLDKSDQDGNNGCGNDIDREDDNEGWCGSKPKPAAKVKAKDKGKDEATDDVEDEAVDEAEEEDEAEDNVAGDEATVDGGLTEVPEVDDSSPTVDTSVTSDEVLGTRVTRGSVAGSAAAAAEAEEATLPFTGARIATILLIGLGLIGTGLFLARGRMN